MAEASGLCVLATLILRPIPLRRPAHCQRPVEGAYKNLIKDRMERSGMRWSEAMADAVVKLRAIFPLRRFDCYWEFHIQQDQ